MHRPLRPPPPPNVAIRASARPRAFVYDDGNDEDCHRHDEEDGIVGRVRAGGRRAPPGAVHDGATKAARGRQRR